MNIFIELGYENERARKISRMKLQMALDFTDLKEAKTILAEVNHEIDIVEIGTPFVIRYGINAVTEIKGAYPNLTVLADLKIMDAGEHEAKMAFEAGADIVTVLGVSDDATIKGAIEAAKKFDKWVMVDMIGVKDIEARTVEVDRFGVDYICVHSAFDIQSAENNPLLELQKLNSVIKKAKAAVAGGINLETIESIIKEKPEIIIVGGGITGKADKKKTAHIMKEKMNEQGSNQNEHC